MQKILLWKICTYNKFRVQSEVTTDRTFQVWFRPQCVYRFFWQSLFDLNLFVPDSLAKQSQLMCL